MDQPFEKHFAEELADIFDAENQILKALPKIIDAVSSTELKQAFEQHRIATQGQVRRLEQIFSDLGTQPQKKCKGMAGLLAEGEEIMNEDLEPHIMDAAIIGACQKVEHYEIAAYGTARTFAALLGNEEAVELLEETLEEEKEADNLLTEIAESQINVEAVTGEGESEESGEEEIAQPRASRDKTTADRSRGRSTSTPSRSGSGKGGSRSARKG